MKYYVYEIFSPFLQSLMAAKIMVKGSIHSNKIIISSNAYNKCSVLQQLCDPVCEKGFIAFPNCHV